MKYALLGITFLCSLSSYAQEQEINAFDAGFADLMGYDVALDGDYAIVGAPLQGGFGTMNAGAAYIFQQVGGVWTSVKKLTPPYGGMPGDQYGYSVDITGGYVIVGAIKVDHYGIADVGAAYIYAGSGSSWYLVATLRPHDGESGDNFGNSVGISGIRAVVGSAKDDDHGTSSGSAYVFEDYYGNGWIEVDKLTALDAGAGDAFGTDVSISGNHIIVGAPGNVGVDHKYSGAAYIFTYGYHDWSESARLIASDADFFDHFGESVDIFGTQLIVGAPFANDKTGKAYVFTSNSNWVEEAILEAADGAPLDKFGFGVGITSGIAAVGAFRDDDQGEDSGSMYLFEQSGTTWSQLMKHGATDGALGDHFGFRVDIDGDYAISGAPYHSHTTTSDGAAYIFGPSLAMACANQMVLTGNIPSGMYHAADHIIAKGVIAPSNLVGLNSLQYIQLQPGFETQSGGVLEILIQGCP